MAGTGKQKRQSKKKKNGSAGIDDGDRVDDGDLKDLPPKLMSYMMPFQKEGVLFAVKKGGRCLIADEMGLGKTLQAIAVASYFQSEWPLLIIVPSSLRYVWIEELEKWLPDILPHEINLIQGGFDTGGIAEARVTIVTYGLLSCKSSGPVKEALKTQQFKIAICDESHYFKNSRTECCKAVTPLLTSASRCILLSGTPALAKPSELFTQLDALQPGKFGSFWSFTKKFCAAHWEFFGRRRQWRADGASNLDELQQQLQSVMIRREKSSVLKQLPPKQRQKILFALKDSQTKKEILTIFGELKPLLKKSKSSLAVNLLGGETTTAAAQGPDGSHNAPKADTNILSRIQKLYNLTGEAKIGPAREYIQMLCENSSLKFLVFAYHHSMMNGLQQTLWDKKIKFVRIDGQTKPSDRQLYVQQFQSDKDTRVALLSILAAGVGLTFTAATLVVFAELYWTPGVMVQCEDRAHRIGQTSTVPVHYLVARETMDEWVWSAVCRKTLVTSTALTGRRQALQADAGERYQVELLSAADAYTPEDNEEIDILQLVQSQRPPDQKSILDFFGSQSDASHSSQTSAKPSTSHDIPHISDDAKALDETDDAQASPARNNQGRKRPFPLFTSLKKTPLSSASKPRVTSEPVLIHSSDEEFQSVNTSSSRVEGGISSERKKKNSRTQNTSQTKAGTARKRKHTVDDTDDKPDSELEDSSSVSSHSAKKKKVNSGSKSSTSLPLSAHSHSKKRRGESDTSGRSAGGRGEQWACVSCTFSNSSLLPFCEICETPRKEKGQTSTQKASSSAKPSNHASSPASKPSSPLSLEDDLELSSPMCSSTQISKQKLRERQGREGKVSVCEDDSSSETTSGKSSGRHRVKRNLIFGADKSQTDLEKDRKKTPEQRTQHSDMFVSTSPEEEKEDADASQETESGDKDGDMGEDHRTGEDSERVCFQLNSSFDQEDRHNSLSDHEEEEEEQDTLVVSDDDTENISSFSSPESCHSGNRENGLSVMEAESTGCDIAEEDGSVDSCSADRSHAQKCEDMNGTAKMNGTVESESEGSETEDVLPKAKVPKRKSFRLGTPEKQCVEKSPRNHASDSTGSGSPETREKSKRTPHRFKPTPVEPKQTPEKSKRTSKTSKPTSDECKQSPEKTEQAFKKSNHSCKKPASGEETDERTGESAIDGEDKPQEDEAPSSNGECGSSEGSREAGTVRDKDTAQGEEAVSVSGDGGGDHCVTQGDLQQQAGDDGDHHSFFMFSCSSYTGRVYLFDQDGQSLKANFLPLDVELDNVSELPDILHHPHHLRLAQHFVRQWNSLTDTKRRLITKRGLKFRHPLAAYDTVRTDLANNKQRYHTKEEQAQAALKKAREVKGSVRLLSKHRPPAQLSVPQDKESQSAGDDATQVTSASRGYVQALSAEGRPLCVHCQQACSPLVSTATPDTDPQSAWSTRFCSRVCADAHWMKTNTTYLRSSVYDVQHGVCQLCGFDAHSFFSQIRDGVDRKQRAEKINNSRFCKMAPAQKKQMIARPYEGQFWHVDHIRPVWEGGGQCDIDNLRTLCTPCHLSVTAKQASKRAQARKLSTAAFSGDITAFFKKS